MKIRLLRLSIKDVPTNPQKYTMDILPITKAIKYFLKSILTRPATIFTTNAGVNGIATTKTSLPVDIFLNIFLYLFKSSLFSVNLSNLLPNPFLNIKYDAIQPIIVKNQDTKNPYTLPITNILTVINKARGIIGNIDSILIKAHAITTPSAPEDEINSTNFSINSTILTP